MISKRFPGRSYGRQTVDGAACRRRFVPHALASVATLICLTSSFAAEPPSVILSGEDDALLRQTIEAVRASNDDARRVAEMLGHLPEPSEDAPAASPPARSKGRRGRRAKAPSSQKWAMSEETFQRFMSSRKAYQTKLSIIANNLANTDTVGFKKCLVVMEDQPYRYDRLPGAEDSGGNVTATGVMVGMGVCVSGVQADFGQGVLQEVGAPLNVAIVGRGFFTVQDPSTRETLYTRAGNFSTNANGQFTLGSAGTGRLLDPPITVPEDATDILIGSEGDVAVRQPGNTSFTQIGAIELAIFINPEGLLRLGENLLSETESSGPPRTGTPGQTGIGTIRQGYLESSNVDPDEETLRWEQTVRMIRRLDRLMGE